MHVSNCMLFIRLLSACSSMIPEIRQVRQRRALCPLEHYSSRTSIWILRWDREDLNGRTSCLVDRTTETLTQEAI
ncbi:hypothetical protein F5Y04DRAFT_265505 [Hypomontagnella monticulosa]|nr:hypothetical protein F5Y04DRAFT_265505 [Hypomontagnella monticulosa]